MRKINLSSKIFLQVAFGKALTQTALTDINIPTIHQLRIHFLNTIV